MKVFEAGKRKWHDQALWHVRDKRDHAMYEVAEWEQLRTLASGIKDHTLDHLEKYLVDFEAALKGNGVHVYWAKDAQTHNEIVHKILREKQIRKVVKSKSMLTEECQLNTYLEAHGVEVVDTDLGERIIQLRKEQPSHIVLPAIHLKKEEVSETFSQKLHTSKGNADPAYLANAARKHLRSHFLDARAAITGVNFGVASTGHVVVCTNEGNADLGMNMAHIQIHSMGIEKVIPDPDSLGIFIRLLARSATGQPITVYTSHYQKPKKGGEMHVILVDNGRSAHLSKPGYRNGLKCIRCGACMNTCPVYRRAGGHHYNATIPGPIGAVSMPVKDMEKFRELPFASTLCGSCTDVCPVKIDLHDQLYRWRQDITNQLGFSGSKSLFLKMLKRILSNPSRLERAGNMARTALRILPAWLLEHKWNTWAIGRKMPDPPEESFRAWYRKNRKHEQQT